MLMVIIDFIMQAFSFFKKTTDVIEAKNLEVDIKNKYTQDKKIDVLEEDKKSRDLIDQSSIKTDKAKEIINSVKDVNIQDSKLTVEQVAQELSEISDDDQREKRKTQIDLAKEIKEKADKMKKSVEQNEKFNAGEEITFKGWKNDAV